MIYGFGEFELDGTAYELRQGAEPVKLEPKVFDVLHLLVQHSNRVVSKSEFLETLWPGEFVTESALPRAITAARKALKDDRVKQAWIRTVHGRGYQFVGTVRERGARGRGAIAAAEPRARSEARAAALVGREATLERMQVAVEDAAGSRGRLILLFGEPGIGKTRTAEELTVGARERGFDVLTGRCYEGAGAPAFWPWVQILRSCTEEVGDGELQAELGREAATVAHLVPELAGRLPEPPEPLVATGDEARFRLFDGVTRYLQRKSQAKPLVLFLDDLHWADKPSSLLLRFLAAELKASALLVIGAYREVELRRGSPLGAVLAELSRLPHAERVPLRGLERSAVQRFIELATGAAPEEALVSAVAEITQGNPFFLNETVRLLRAQGAVEAAAQAWASPAAASGDARAAWDAALPQGLRDVIGRRLDGLSEECNRVLTLASVIGVEFALPVLERFAETSREALLEVLDEAVRARVITESPETPGRHSFAHALIRQSIYDELPTPVRVRLHRQLGEILEALYGESAQAHIDALAHHFFQAAPGGDVDKAIDYAVRVGKAAQRLFAYEEGAAWFTRALQALDLRATDDEVRRCQLLLELGGAYDQSGERKRMREAFSQAANRARNLGRPDLLALAALGFAGRTERGASDSGMRALLEEALEALGEGDRALRARILGYLLGTPPYNDSVETRLALSQQAVELARAARDPLALMGALAARSWAMAGPDHLEERLLVAGELLELGQQTGHVEAQFSGLEARLRSLLIQGDMVAADGAIAAYVQLAEEQRQPAFRFLATVYRVARALSRGRFDEAEKLIEHGATLGRAAQHPASEPIYWGQRIWLHLERGELERLPELLASVLESGVWAFPYARPAASGIRMLIDLAAGREEEARRLFDEVAAHDFLDFPHGEHWHSIMASLVTTSVALGDAPRTAQLYELLAPYASLNIVHDLLRTDLGSTAHYLGVLARELGRCDTAVAHFEEALAMNTRMGARPHQVRTQQELGSLLLERGRRGDAKRARALLEGARAGAAQLGMVRLEG